MRSLSALDEALASVQRALATLQGEPAARRERPAAGDAVPDSPDARREAAALMRVNHVGEICAQALYEAQALGTRDPGLKRVFRDAAAEEIDHLAWTQQRIRELGGRTSLLAPFWYAGAFCIGLLASRFGDRASLGFMAETERQVEAHLRGHLERLPADDAGSRAIVEQMQRDELHHAHTAIAMGAIELPLPARAAMRLAAKVMTTVAHYV